jgi:3D (Asp-Asp-Asp) domain-containing protein
VKTLNWLLKIAAAGVVLNLAGCASHPLPKYERPLSKTPYQSVRTTAYTWTESDHILYGKSNALGGQLCIAPPPPKHPSQGNRRAKTHRRNPHRGHTKSRDSRPESVQIQWNSAAADWSRWPAGTLFRLTSNGQFFRVDDYGWALAGRNTIDLCMPSKRAMNLWGVRQETIQILRWGDPAVSHHILCPRRKYKHVRRMILELENKPRQASKLR